MRRLKVRVPANALVQQAAPMQQAAPVQQGARVRPGADEGHVADGDVPVLQALVQQRVPEVTQRPAVRYLVQQPLLTK